jgi:hypothetical protein
MCCLKKICKTLWGNCQRVVNALWYRVTSLQEVRQKSLKHLQESCSINIQRDNLSVIRLKNLTSKIWNQEEIDRFKSYHRCISKLCSIHSYPNSQLLSRTTDALNSNRIWKPNFKRKHFKWSKILNYSLAKYSLWSQGIIFSIFWSVEINLLEVFTLFKTACNRYTVLQ